MRLHHLEITAFGPFADRTSVDFDHLSAAGLFLLSGATGAGKSSVLDAVCFAIYGDVPGDRATAKRLRSDQAGPGAVPRVVLEATLGGRRFRIARSPAYDRPKRRGEGTTPQQAAVVVAERINGDWVTLATRLDEAGQLLGGLLGMTLGQFTQVAMLPQGRFQTFLRARSDERHQVLQQVFRTGRFEDVERWLRERRVSLRRRGEVIHQQLADLVSRASEADDQPLPDRIDLRDLGPVLADGSLSSWLDDRAQVAAHRAGQAAAAAGVAERGEVTTRTALEAGRLAATRRARLAAARAEQAVLDADTDGHRVRVRMLDAARRAAVVVPVAEAATRTRALEGRADGERARAVAAAVTALGRGDLDEAVLQASEQVARVSALRPSEARLRQLRHDIGAAGSAQAAVEGQLAETDVRRTALPLLRAAAQAELEAVREQAGRLEAATLEVRRLDAQRAATDQVRILSADLETARAAHLAARELAHRAHETWLDLRERRLDGMAAEMAAQLAVGDSCPVCGSADHPVKASPRPGAPEQAEEKAAQRAHVDAQAEEHARDTHVRELTLRIATASARAGDLSPAASGVAIEAARLDLAQATEAGRILPTLAHAVSALDHEREGLETRVTQLAAQAAEFRVREESLRHEETGLQAELSALLGGMGHPDLAALAEDLATRVRLGRAALDAGAEHRRAAKARQAAEEALDAAVGAAGFGSRVEATAAVVTPGRIDVLADDVAGHEQRLAGVRRVLQELEGVDEPTDREPPDVVLLEVAHRDALEQLAAARGTRDVTTGRATRLADLAARLELAVAAWTPVHGDLELTTRLAAFVEGKAADNAWQMRLSAYVVAYRLGQVVAAANERLASMSGQRYSLEHTGRRGAGETRGGLSLEVVDDWSGAHRDPATLSGGETFVVSLALALGLADVIAQEAGGAELETLFVDEGFGSLDSDTLDDVMDTLDALRDGGRVVGVVSHVAEMRDRIPTQLRVAKSRAGSTLSTTPA